MMGYHVMQSNKKHPVTAHSLGAARRNFDSLAGFAENPEVLSYHLCGFLNVSLTGDAWTMFTRFKSIMVSKYGVLS